MRANSVKVFIAIVQISVNECRNVVKFMGAFSAVAFIETTLCARSSTAGCENSITRRTNAKALLQHGFTNILSVT